ncbi:MULTISPECIES: catalase [Deinococcus]|uniref:Catalase n=1 Tax=Deinococcus rufus TaxID=2136097 RepID=A0ABV7Z8B8_9DEIO|nr:catalase [Deinococcus sp. AB2017081]WQE97239.1 catalase [Deinococcus sp. AB2017081]
MAKKPTKQDDLARNVTPPGTRLTDNLGHAISDDQNSLTAGPRGPTLLEDFLLREKIHHFDHERIPERVVHARGAGAHGYFQLDTSLAEYTRAEVLTEVGVQTPVFARFSTVAGSRGSADTARDVRGFAVRMYTSQGNWDIVGNNIPVFFIQDAIKFPDLIHSVKPEPHNEIPQAASAHDTFYDFISLTPEAMHMLLWVHSDRGIPRSFSMMEGFGVHTFRLVNARGQAHFVKFHWKPALGAHSLVWDEAQKIAGKDPDFHRRTMWETIDQGGTLEWSLGVQVFTAEQAARWDFDVLDATKLIPEDLVPVRRVGRLVLNRNPDNYFSETEQVAFMTTNVVPGIDFSDDPLLQGRNFSYLDTQLSRLGSPNWPELPINRPLVTVSNNQRDGHMRQTINPGRVSYFPNTLGGGQPAGVPAARGGFATFPEPVGGVKLRARPESFSDHYGQARLFWNSQAPIEKEHIVKSLQFELSKVDTRAIRMRMLDHLEQIHPLLASQVALALGEKARASEHAVPGGSADAAAETRLLAGAIARPTASGKLLRATALSLESGQPKTPKGRRVAILAADGVSAEHVAAVQRALKTAGAGADVVGLHLGELGGGVSATKTLGNTDAVLYDAVLIPGGARSAQALSQQGDALAFLAEAYKHGKPVAALGEGVEVLSASEIGRAVRDTPPAAPAASAGDAVQHLSEVGSARRLTGAGSTALAEHGIFVGTNGQLESALGRFVTALAEHRFWGRPRLGQVPV